MAKPRKDGYRVGAGEKFSYGLYFLGQNIFYALIAFNVQIFFTDMGITAAVVGVVLLITKIWDAVNDPLFGIVLDKVRFKKGRFLPWVRISLPLIALSSIFLFSMPDGASPTVKVVWAVLGYVFWDMSYTVCDVPIFVLPTSMTDNITERTGILSLGRMMAMVGILGANIPLAILQARMGWNLLAIVYTSVGVLAMVPLCFAAKERNIVRPEKEVTLGQMWKYLKGNKYLWIFYISMLIANLSNFSQGMTLYFARYNLGKQELGSLLSMATALPMLVIAALVPILVKKVDKFNIYTFCLLGGAITGILRYFVGYGNFTVFMLLTIVSGVFYGGWGLLLFMFTPDCVEYGTYHTGERAEGIAFSVQTFFTKLTGSITASMGLFILAMFGFVSGDVAVQPTSAQNGIWMCMSVFPAVGLLLALLVLRKYKLRDKDVQVMARYNGGHISREEADAQLSAKYGPAANLTEMEVIDASR